MPRRANVTGRGSATDPFVLDNDDAYSKASKGTTAVTATKRRPAAATAAAAVTKRPTNAVNPNIQAPPRKRRIPGSTQGARVAASPPSKRTKTSQAPARPKKLAQAPEDQRPKRFRDHDTIDFQTKKSRALTQPMCVLSRRSETRPSQSETLPTYPIETLEMAGTTGNLYTVTIDKVLFCSCPSSAKTGQCKHIIYVMVRVLKAQDQHVRQLGLTENELREIFARAPKIDARPSGSSNEDESGRKPIEGDCPICFCEFETGEQVVWCKAACGNNVHDACFRQWAAQSKGGGTCPFCRSKWVSSGPDKIGKIDRSRGRMNADGYVNVGNQLGLCGIRDTSSYHSYWVDQQRREGRWFDEDAVGWL